VLVPKFVCEVACASGFALFMDGDVPWDTGSIVWKMRPNSIALEKGNLGTHMRAVNISGRNFQSNREYSIDKTLRARRSLAVSNLSVLSVQKLNSLF